MKKLIVALVLVLVFSSAAFAGKSGNFGISAGSLIQRGEPEIILASPFAAMFYYFTDNLSGELGLSYGNMVGPAPFGDYHEDITGILTAMYYNFGRSGTIPRLGIQADFITETGHVPSIVDFEIKPFVISVVFGVEADLLPGLTMTLDAVLVRYQSLDINSDLGGDNDYTQFCIFPAYRFGLRWYIM